MIYPMVPFPVTLSDPLPRFQGHGVIIDALVVLCAQMACDLFAIAKFLLHTKRYVYITLHYIKCLVPGLQQTRPARQYKCQR